MGRLQEKSCCPQPDRGNPAVRDEMGGCRKLIEARNEAPACSDEEPVTATPRCPPTQRLRSIPTRQRPLGVPALEDKIVQRAAVEVLNAIYETDFLGFSYGVLAAAKPERPRSLGSNAAPHYSLAAFAICLSSLSSAAHGRCHLRQEPDALCGLPIYVVSGR
jgi:hypothetical protein